MSYYDTERQRLSAGPIGLIVGVSCFLFSSLFSLFSSALPGVWSFLCVTQPTPAPNQACLGLLKFACNFQNPLQIEPEDEAQATLHDQATLGKK